MRRIASLTACAMAGAVLLAGSPARAGVTLLTVTDTSALFEKPFLLPFTATATSTTISFQGYNASDFEYVYGASVTHNGGANLLGDSWTKTPAASGSEAYQTTVRTLEFGGVSGKFDTFSQTFETTPGAHYELTFDFAGSTFALFDLSAYSPSVISLLSELFNSNSLRVLASGSAPSIPEPSTWAMMLIGLAGLGSLRYRWRGWSSARGVGSPGSVQ